MKIIKIAFLFFLISFNVFSDTYEVKTNSGITHGYQKNGVISFDDIPYAKPPLGELRWKAPRKLDISAKENVIQHQENNFCVQEPSGLGGSDGDSFFSGSEDCLYLDIKRPKKTGKDLLPVMFWIHGGGNTSGLKDLYDFSKMVKKHDVIVVTINYRLGPFGWFTHPSIQDFQFDLDKTSNFGTLDIIAALEWVQSNISLFNGDPNNVTIFGESAGGHNVLSLLVAKQATDLFHKAISQSGYTTTSSKEAAYKQINKSSTSKHTSWNIVNKIIEDTSLDIIQEDNLIKVRDLLKNITAEEFFKYYSERQSYENLSLLTADGIVIPEIGLTEALSREEYVNNVPTIAGSNKDEVKLWLASAKYFVDLDYSFFGSIFEVPKVVLNDKDAFNLFNSYRSRAWKIRGVDEPLRNLYFSGNANLYAYRYDWDDHRRFIIADFKELIGAAHATEIPLLTGNNKLVGDYGFLIYPKGLSKRFTSKNMMKFWSNFAKEGKPGISSNKIEWTQYNGKKNMPSSYIILDNRRNLRMHQDNFSFSSLLKDLHKENALTKLEKCVVLLQMLTYVGDDVYDMYIDDYPGKCDRAQSEKFLKDNASFIDY
ncbi:MAG: carboxylesterase family protein [Flavobacteriaceae bacterium]|nr:carboxylesterase family protein [Flavobacteriaceae bacterium]